MLPHKMASRAIHRLGMDDAYHGRPKQKLPEHIREHYSAGYELGTNQRHLELADGSHPSLKAPVVTQPSRVISRRRK